MKYVFLFIVVLVFSAPGFAQQLEIKTRCDEVVVNADVQGATYRPGISIDGKRVPSADLNSNIKALNYPIRIPVEIDILEFIDVDVPSGVVLGEEADVAAAYFDVFEVGRVEYNGQDISSNAVHSCHDGTETEAEVVVKESEVVEEETPKADQKDGQNTPDSVTSGDKVEADIPQPIELENKEEHE